MKRLEKWLPVIGLALVGVVSFVASGQALLVLHESAGSDPFQFDLLLLRLVQERTPIAWEPALRALTVALNLRGVWLLAVLSALVMLLLWWSGRRFEAAGVGTAALLAGAGVGLAKLYFQRVRPATPWALVQDPGYSFPSGHAATAVVLYGMCAYLVWRLTGRWWLGGIASVGAVVLALGTGYSRVYLGAHYPTDVLAGFVSGAIWLAASIAVTETLYLLSRPGILQRTHRRIVLAHGLVRRRIASYRTRSSS